MFNGKTHYKRPFSIAFCMFTRPGTFFLRAKRGLAAFKLVTCRSAKSAAANFDKHTHIHELPGLVNIQKAIEHGHL